jgi:hypothetical protein
MLFINETRINMRNQITKITGNAPTVTERVVSIKCHASYVDARVGAIKLVSTESASHVELSSPELTLSYVNDWLVKRGETGKCLYVYCEGRPLALIWVK